VIDILALLGYRRAPRPRRAAGNGRWQDAAALEAPAPAARAEAAKRAPAKTRPQPGRRRDPAHAYLAAHGLEKSYGGRRVVKGVSLYVRRGEAGGLRGPNGAGKTTAFYTITGLIKPERGQIELDGYDVTHLPMYQRSLSASATCRRKPRSSAGSTSRKTSAPCSR